MLEGERVLHDLETVLPRELFTQVWIRLPHFGWIKPVLHHLIKS